MPSDARLLLVDRDAAARLLAPADVLAAVREAFCLHSAGSGRIFPVVREALPTGGIFGIKSGDVPAQALLGFKAAGFWPGNRQQGGEPHQATIMLVDPATGRPRCIIDGNAITTARTGAAGALGLQQFARPGSSSACVFGTGVQARVQLDYALAQLQALRTVRYVTWNGQPDAGFEQAFARRDATLAHATDANAAVAASDIVITATPGGGPMFAADAVRPGTHLNCVGADTRGKRELPEGLLPRVRLFADDLAQARQIGETQWAPELDAQEIGHLLAGTARFARSAEDITVFDMTGIALQDLTVARHVHQRALAEGLGTQVAWPW